MTTAECSACGAKAKVVRERYRFAECGLPNVVLVGVEVIQCPVCGNRDPIIPRLNRLMRLLAVAVVAKPYKLEGEDVRFLRKYLRMSGDEFSALLHIDKTTLSKWENNEQSIGDQSDRLIRAVTMALGEGLKDKMEEVVRAFSRIHGRTAKTRIAMDPEKMQYEYA
jgi:DNA-binding transcriptional regulator YiaG